MPTRRPDPGARLIDNRLLAALPPEEYDRIAPHCTIVHLKSSAPIYDMNARIEQVYFPLSGMISVVALMADGNMVEAGTIGREGMTGLPIFYGDDHSPLLTFAQVPGDHARLPIAVFREALVPGTTLYRLTQLFAQSYFVLTAQSAGCNRLHPNEERCARWLLLTQDRVGAATFSLSHEFLGMMLGTRRASVTLAMSTLQRAGLITYRRGVVTITDHPGLEAATCECYGIITARYARAD
ncbi:MAG TPA: Crp/Fnr family transcriptional regulator [Thermomicrobiales bacterium]|jgi:CRP-like cAMP-binding protein